MESLRERLYALNKLDKRRLMAQWVTDVAQQRRKHWHDQHIRRARFTPRQLVLKYNGRNEIKPGKFKVRWLGPFRIREVNTNGAIKLWMLDGKEIPDAINKSKLKVYHERREPGTPSQTAAAKN
ncbi:uncharacterized protein LOC131875698 [Cryptomeria japonica]|uniref:uncharacterized protein LOC131875698 n=1 Tax=Cryptomeria japonica TaxID=3369 RepID=UPI0027DA62C7|nr:uncharacterized protein LOC131875698 [Cryptomeria japonica]